MPMDNVFKELQSKYQDGLLTPGGSTLSGITPPGKEDIIMLPKGHQYQHLLDTGRNAIEHHGVGAIIVTGGMATRFKYDKPKALFPVINQRTFLELKIAQYKPLGIPVFLMVSFATEGAIRQYLEENDWFDYKDHIALFSQFSLPRLSTDGTACEDRAASGHGDVFPAFQESGLLHSFMKKGGKYLLFSNIDNLGASLSDDGLAILGLHITSGKDMSMEVAQKNPGDKGGAPAKVNGRLQIVEQFLFPRDFDQDSISVFNTATYIFSTQALTQTLPLPWYAVEKERDGEIVIQFERLAGDASAFLSNQAILINREERFLPVKKQEDISLIAHLFKRE